MFVGYEYKHVRDDGDGSNTYESTATNTVTFDGQLDQFSLSVVGNEEAANSIHYCKTRTNWQKCKEDEESDLESGEEGEEQDEEEEEEELPPDTETLYIWGATENTHSYTNFIVFNGKYGSDGGGLPSKFMYFPWLTSQTADRFQCHTLARWEASAIGSQLDLSVGSWTTKKIDIELEQTIGEDGFVEMVSALLYADCHFVIQAAGANATRRQNPDEYFSDHVFTVRTTKMRNVTSQGFTPYISTMGIAESKIVNDYFINGGPHQWVLLFNLPNMFEISGVSNACQLLNPRIMFVGREGHGECYLGDATSEYARWTGYWYESTEGKILKSDGKSKMVQFQGSGINNKTVTPIYKPWAECDLIVFQSGSNEPFATEDYSFFERKLDQYYESYEIDASDPTGQTMNVVSYRQCFFVNANRDRQTNMKTMKKYAKVKSPFRNEMYVCHGSRNEYDTQNPEDHDGSSGIVYANNRRFSRTFFQRMHNVIAKWNGSDTCLGIVMDCCFGGGMQRGLQRNVLKNGTCWNAANLVDGIDNVFYYVDSTATHVGLGNPTGGYFLPIVKQAWRSNHTYKGMADKFNATIQQGKAKTFALIRKFFVDNYDKMLSCVDDDDDKAAWNYSKSALISDMQTGGKAYFSTFDWPSTADGQRVENFYVSDNYFDPQKHYRINAGFVGYIKSKIFPDIESRSTTYFTMDQDNQENYNYIESKVLELRDNIHQIYTRLGCAVPSDAKYSAIVEPVMGCSGKYLDSRTKLMKNPALQVDNWLTSDNDLETLMQGQS